MRLSLYTEAVVDSSTETVPSWGADITNISLRRENEMRSSLPSFSPPFTVLARPVDSSVHPRIPSLRPKCPLGYSLVVRFIYDLRRPRPG